MSRSNTNYYNVCDPPLDQEGYCDRHQGWHRGGRCTPTGEFRARRCWSRKKRFPRWSWKRYSRGPSRDVKRSWQRRLRSMMKAEVVRHGEVLLDAGKMLRGWYGWWS